MIGSSTSPGGYQPPDMSSQGQSWLEKGATEAWEWISGAWDGPEPIRVCPGEWSPAAIYQVLQRATEQELQPIQSWIDKGGMADKYRGPARTANPQVLAHGLMGGDDCDFDWAETIQANGRMQDLVMRYANGVTGAGNVQTTETYYPPPITTSGGAPSELERAKDSVWDGIKDFFGGIFRGAASGAATAAQSGGTASQLTSQTTIINVVLPLLFLAFLVWFVMRKRG